MARVPRTELNDREKFCLDGYVLSGDAVLAYTLSRRNRIKTDDADTIRRMAVRWLKRPEVVQYIYDRRLVISGNAPKVTEGKEIRDKDAIVKELNQLASETKDTKLKSEILLKIADLQQMKKPVVEEEDNTVHYYLPLSCNNCSLYVKYGRVTPGDNSNRK